MQKQRRNDEIPKFIIYACTCFSHARLQPAIECTCYRDTDNHGYCLAYAIAAHSDTNTDTPAHEYLAATSNLHTDGSDRVCEG